MYNKEFYYNNINRNVSMKAFNSSLIKIGKKYKSSK